MSVYNEDVLVEKLSKLIDTQQSIQGIQIFLFCFTLSFKMLFFEFIIKRTCFSVIAMDYISPQKIQTNSGVMAKRTATSTTFPSVALSVCGQRCHAK
jgi:hypothetical protein